MRNQPKAVLVKPVGNQQPEVTVTAGASNLLLGCQRRVPGQNLEAVEPTILDHQKPVFTLKTDASADRARYASWEKEIHGCFSYARFATAEWEIAERKAARSVRGTVSIPSLESKCKVK